MLSVFISVNFSANVQLFIIQKDLKIAIWSLIQMACNLHPRLTGYCKKSKVYFAFLYLKLCKLIILYRFIVLLYAVC